MFNTNRFSIKNDVLMRNSFKNIFTINRFPFSFDVQIRLDILDSD